MKHGMTDTHKTNLEPLALENISELEINRGLITLLRKSSGRYDGWNNVTRENRRTLNTQSLLLDVFSDSTIAVRNGW